MYTGFIIKSNSTFLWNKKHCRYCSIQHQNQSLDRSKNIQVAQMSRVNQWCTVAKTSLSIHILHMQCWSMTSYTPLALALLAATYPLAQYTVDSVDSVSSESVQLCSKGGICNCTVLFKKQKTAHIKWNDTYQTVPQKQEQPVLAEWPADAD